MNPVAFHTALAGQQLNQVEQFCATLEHVLVKLLNQVRTGRSVPAPSSDYECDFAIDFSFAYQVSAAQWVQAIWKRQHVAT
jgi:hypothetical protein